MARWWDAYAIHSYAAYFQAGEHYEPFWPRLAKPNLQHELSNAKRDSRYESVSVRALDLTVHPKCLSFNVRIGARQVQQHVLDVQN